MINTLLLSTGCLVERRNGYDTTKVGEIIPALMDKSYIDGAELMMIGLYYEKLPMIIDTYRSSGAVFPVIHADKEIGTLLSNAAVAYFDGGKSLADETRIKAFDMLKKNCEAACMAESSRMVLHLWGGLCSDTRISYNIEALPQIIDITDSYGVRLMCENVPSVKADPLTNWIAMGENLGRCGLVFDTRFATCHRQPAETLSSDCARFIEHIHISDYIGEKKDFSCLRPVYHPGEGIADFPLIFSMLKKMDYSGSFTLESQGITDGTEINIDRMCRSFEFIKDSMSG